MVPSRIPVRFLALPAVILSISVLASCSLDRRSWYSHGEYQAIYTDETGTARNITGTVSRSEGITTDHKVRLCDLRRVKWGLPWSPEVGRVVSLDVRLPKPLCQVGEPMSVSGSAIVVGHPGGDTTLVTGVSSEDWTVEGTVQILEVTDPANDDPDVGEEVVVETARGTFDLIAIRAPTDTLRLEGGQFLFRISVLKYTFEP